MREITTSNEDELTEMKAEEKYNTQMSIMQDLCAGDVSSDLILM